MRRIEEEMIAAFHEKRIWTKDNTRVWVVSFDFNKTLVDQIYVTLFGYKIAQLTNDKELSVLDAGYRTKTTKSRLNSILSHYKLPTIYSKKLQWYIGDEEWNGNKTFEIKNNEY